MSGQTVGVMGLGSWGTALANHLASAGHDVLGWTNQPEVFEGIIQKHRNPLYLSDVDLNPALRVTTTLTDLSKCPIVVLVLPSAALATVIPALPFRPRIFVSAVKGLERSTQSTPIQFCSSVLGPAVGCAVLSGPSFANDVVRRMPSGVVAAHQDESCAREVAELFGTEWMRVYLSTDTLGVELGGIIKNVIAMAVGISDGLHLGDSARAMLITRGLAEMMRLGQAMGADPQTFMGLAGLGDLAMTATSDLSRNRRVGLRLGKGDSLETILGELGAVAEGVATAGAVLKMAQDRGVEMPIVEHVAAVLVGKMSPKEAVRALISRPLKREF